MGRKGSNRTENKTSIFSSKLKPQEISYHQIILQISTQAHVAQNMHKASTTDI